MDKKKSQAQNYDRKEKPLVFLSGNIMSRGDYLARAEEVETIQKANANIEIFSPVLEKSINDKKNMSEEKNNHLAELILSTDSERLYKSDAVVICPESNAIGTVCELGQLGGFKMMAEKLSDMITKNSEDGLPEAENFRKICEEINRIKNKKCFPHIEDIRDTELNEKRFRRSWSQNQYKYGLVLYLADTNRHPEGYETMEEIAKELVELYGTNEE